MKNFNKIFGIGCPKTGTSSLSLALKILNFKHKSWDPNLWRCYKKRKYKDIFLIADKYDSFDDGPWSGPDLHNSYFKRTGFYQLLDKKYPDSKFILTIRDTKSWIKSHELHFSEETGLHNITKDLRIKNYKTKRDKIIKNYIKRNDEIITYFKKRPDDLLIINICKSEGWRKLCVFLNISTPKNDFPYENKTQN